MALALLNGPETPQEHVRTALTLLDDLEREFRTLGLISSQRIKRLPCTSRWRAVAAACGAPSPNSKGGPMKRDYAEEALWMAEDAFAANFHSYVAGISPYEPDGYCLLWYRGQARAAARLRDMQFRLERVLPERCRVCGQWFSPGVTSIVRCASCRTQHVRGKP